VSCYIAQAGLKLEIILPHLPECWDYRHESPHPENSFLIGLAPHKGCTSLAILGKTQRISSS
jgi:hypothetical protein